MLQTPDLKPVKKAAAGRGVNKAKAQGHQGIDAACDEAIDKELRKHGVRQDRSLTKSPNPIVREPHYTAFCLL